MRREWPGVDHLRLDKFYLLVRFFVRNLFVTLKSRNWDLRALEGFVGVLEKRAFFVDDVDDKGLGNGVTYHIVSVFCDEIKPFLPLSLEVLNLLFRPFLGAMGKSDNKVLVGKVKNHVFDYLVKNGKGLLGIKKSGDEVDEKDEVVLFGTVAWDMGFATRFYELGSGSDCVQGNRKVVFGLHEEFLKLEKEKVSLGIDTSLPEGNGVEDDEEVPQLIPMNCENMDEDAKAGSSKGNGESKASKDKKSKKKKKKKKNAHLAGAGASGSSANSDTGMVNSNGGSSNAELEDVMNALELDQTVISNLQKQFEKIAAESGLDGDGISAIESPPTVQVKSKSKKRKRSKSAVNGEMGSKENTEEEEVLPKTEEKSVKRVRFSMKNNLVWKPQTPLPPQSLRIPPSVTPRGSALKKGLSPGPIRDISQDVKKAKKKKASPLKKARKVKSISPTVKRVKKKVKPMSA